MPEEVSVNLLTTGWIPVRSKTAELHFIRPCDVAEERWTDLVSQRADFHGALYQLLIGLLQTTFPPEDREHWFELWINPPTVAQLEQAFQPWLDAFHLINDGPAFMQDFALPDGCNHQPVLDLLIDAGSDSNLYFNKPQEDSGLCARCVTQALLTLQLNAPSGGRGVRTSLRGGGPLTTLLLPSAPASTLWQKLWINVLPASELSDYPAIGKRADVMPWLAPTRTSDSADGAGTRPEDVHPLQAYWGMPRRIRLDTATRDRGTCTLCGVGDTVRFRHFFTRHGGVNYIGNWQHPLTPYSIDSKGEKPPISIKGRQAGRGYRDWLGLVLGNENHQPDAAKVVAGFTRWRHARKPGTRLWCFGYDMSNMKALCWYDAALPVHEIAPERLPGFIGVVKKVLDSADDLADCLERRVKAARFRRPSGEKADPAVQLDFWQVSELLFFEVLNMLSRIDCDDSHALQPACGRWTWRLETLALAVFDRWTLSGGVEGMDLKRVAQARAGLVLDSRFGAKQKGLRQLGMQKEAEQT